MATIDTLVLLVVVAVLGLLVIPHVKLLREVAALLDGDDSLVACVQTTNNLRELGTTRLNRY
jgi:competence protein ComGC